jgi:hypothetical protein
VIPELEDLVEPVEDEITAQHLILARTSGDSAEEDEGEGEPEVEPDAEAPEAGGETGEPSTDRIGPKDAPISKRQG